MLALREYSSSLLVSHTGEGFILDVYIFTSLYHTWSIHYLVSIKNGYT
jgi:hypothetical protein